MVLQNKFKARASRRYNAARGGSNDGRGRGRGRGGAGRGGSGQGRSYDHEAFPSLPGQEDDEEGDESGEEEEGSSNEEHREGGSGKSADQKYARRKLQSNAWRYQEDEKPVKEGDAETSGEESEVDLSGLFERVAKLDSDRTTQALSSQQAAETSLEAKEQDLDHTLLYLLDRQRERERGKATAAEDDKVGKMKGSSLTSSELKMLEMEGRRLLEENEREKKHHSRAQILKGQKPKVISINIGENQGKHQRQPEQSLRQKTQRTRQINMAALYDDDDDYVDDGEDGVDFSRGARLPPHSHEVSNNSESRRLVSPSTRSRDRDPAAPPKEQQDFLDSII